MKNKSYKFGICDDGTMQYHDKIFIFTKLVLHPLFWFLSYKITIKNMMLVLQLCISFNLFDITASFPHNILSTNDFGFCSRYAFMHSNFALYIHHTVFNEPIVDNIIRFCFILHGSLICIIVATRRPLHTLILYLLLYSTGHGHGQLKTAAYDLNN